MFLFLAEYQPCKGGSELLHAITKLYGETHARLMGKLTFKRTTLIRKSLVYWFIAPLLYPLKPR